MFFHVFHSFCSSKCKYSPLLVPFPGFFHRSHLQSISLGLLFQSIAMINLCIPFYQNISLLLLLFRSLYRRYLMKNFIFQHVYIIILFIFDACWFTRNGTMHAIALLNFNKRLNTILMYLRVAFAWMYLCCNVQNGITSLFYLLI